MVWLNPIALFGLVSVAAPILIHILIQRRAERFPFPTLRFLRPTRLAAIRRHLLEDLRLVAVRVAVVAAAVAALAGPLWVTGARRQAWDRRVARATVTDIAGATPARASARTDQGRPLREETFATSSLTDGVRRAILWLETSPPARREIVIASTFPIGSVTQADVAAIPADIGVRFERSGTLPAARTVPAGRLLTSSGVLAREVILSGPETSVRDRATGDSIAWPIDVVSSEDERSSIDAAIAAVLSQRVWAAPPDRRARVVLRTKVVQASGPASGPGAIDTLADAAPIQQPWMAEAVSRIARDPDLRAAAARVAAGLSDGRFTTAPWQILATAADGRPLASAAGSATRLVVASAAPAADVATPLLLRSIASAIADVPDLQRAEVVPIADAVLRRWTRPAAPVVSPRIETVERDDRRWLWIAVLCLLALETWIRRTKPADAARTRNGDQARVA